MFLLKNRKQSYTINGKGSVITMKDAVVSAWVDSGAKTGEIPRQPQTLDIMTDAELNAKLEHSYKQAAAGKGRPFREVFDKLESLSM